MIKNNKDHLMFDTREERSTPFHFVFFQLFFHLLLDFFLVKSFTHLDINQFLHVSLQIKRILMLAHHCYNHIFKEFYHF